MLMHPVPTPERLRALGNALRGALLGDGRGLDVVVLATGGMSHQIHGTRFGLTNEKWDRYFLGAIEQRHGPAHGDPDGADHASGRHRSLELSMWYTMRAALSPEARTRYSYYTLPAMTGCGVIALEEPR